MRQTLRIIPHRASYMRFLGTVLLLVLVLTACQETSTLDQAVKLGNQEFSPQSWAKASQVERGKMTASFLRKYNATELHRTQIEKLLGHPTGYYYNNNPAYFVGPNTVESIHGYGYLWVFEASKNDGQIERVFFVPEIK